MFQFRKATNVFVKTLPFVMLRIAVGVAFGILAIAYFGAVAWVLTSMLGSVSGWIALVGLAIAGIAFLWFVKLLRKYLLYMVSAGHIAVIAHIVDTGEVPSSQLKFGKDKVADRFAEASVLFGVDQLVSAVIEQFNKKMVSFKEMVSFAPQLRNIVEIIQKAVTLATSFIDEAILAHMFLNEDKNKWRAARDGVVLYGKTWKSVLGSTLAIVTAMHLANFALFVGLTPLASVFGRLAPAVEMLGWVFVAGIVTTAYFGLIKPWVMTVVITTFLVNAEEETPDSETASYISERSEKFRELASKAEDEAAKESPVGTPGDGATPMSDGALS